SHAAAQTGVHAGLPLRKRTPGGASMAAAAPFTVLGKAIPRVEGPDKVRGRAIYTADVTPGGSLWARNVRSPHPHARVVSINTARALAVPGVRAVLTAKDFPNRLIG